MSRRDGAGRPSGALEPAFASVPGFRRIYPDLPGMGGATAPAGLSSDDDVVDVLLGFLDRVVGEERFLLSGHSLGGYLAQAVAARRRDKVAGLALICPAGRSSRDVPEHTVVHAEGDPTEVLDRGDLAGFEEYFVIRTPMTARHYRDRVLPGTELVDEAALGRIFGGWSLRDEPGVDGPHTYPTLIMAGRQDSSVGWAGAVDLLNVYSPPTTSGAVSARSIGRAPEGTDWVSAG